MSKNGLPMKTRLAEDFEGQEMAMEMCRRKGLSKLNRLEVAARVFYHLFARLKVRL